MYKSAARLNLSPAAGSFFARSVVVIGFMFKYRPGRAVDLVLVLHAL